MYIIYMYIYIYVVFAPMLFYVSIHVLCGRNSYGVWFHMLNLIIYFAYVCCLTGFIVTYDFCGSNTQSSANTTLQKNSTVMEDTDTIQEMEDSCNPPPFVEVTIY